MPMTAPAFLAVYKELKVRAEAEIATAEMREAFAKLAAMFKVAYSADTLKVALAAKEPIDSELEERLTSALVIFNRERTLSGAHPAIRDEE